MVLGMYLSQIKRTYGFLLIILQYVHMSFECLLVAATRITVSLESSDEQQEIQEMGSVEATSKHCDTGYVFV